MSRNNGGSSLLGLLISFFAGAITMLVFLSPGQMEVQNIKKLLTQGEKPKVNNFQQTADKVEKVNDMARFYANQAGKYISEN